MSYRADKLCYRTHRRTHRQTDAGNDNSCRPIVASGNNNFKQVNFRYDLESSLKKQECYLLDL